MDSADLRRAEPGLARDAVDTLLFAGHASLNGLRLIWRYNAAGFEPIVLGKRPNRVADVSARLTLAMMRWQKSAA